VRRWALLGVVLVALALPAAASAHATMKEAHPAEQGEVAAPPTEITLRFDQSVEVPPNAIVVYAPDGKRLSGAVTQTDRNTVMRAPIRGAVKGQAYTVRWRVISADGHVGTGVFTFGVGVAPPPPTEAVGASGVTWRDDVARWALFASLALMIGVVGIRLLVLPRVVDPRAERRVHLLGTLGAFLALNTGIAGFVIRSANALQVGGVDLLYADLSPFAESTRFGNAFLVTTFGFGICLTILVLAWVLDAPLLRWPAFLLGLALVWGYPLSGHQGTEPNSTPLTEIADWLHLVTAMLWVGGVLTLAVVVWPLAPDLRRAAFLRFSRIAVLLIGVLLAAGTFVSIQRLPQLDDLWTTSYGKTLLVKIALVCVALAWGGFHHTFVRPRLERGETPPGVGRSLLGESVVALAVLFAAAVLVNGAPPPVATGSTTATPAASR
jgi:copper transport protein